MAPLYNHFLWYNHYIPHFSTIFRCHSSEALPSDNAVAWLASRLLSSQAVDDAVNGGAFRVPEAHRTDGEMGNHWALKAVGYIMVCIYISNSIGIEWVYNNWALNIGRTILIIFWYILMIEWSFRNDYPLVIFYSLRTGKSPCCMGKKWMGKKWMGKKWMGKNEWTFSSAMVVYQRVFSCPKMMILKPNPFLGITSTMGLEYWHLKSNFDRNLKGG
jgi:hypothetical protein